MMDLLLNLISEAIGILVTVLIVDRLLEKHEERRWQEVRTLVLSRANMLCRRIVYAWKDFLIAISQKEQNNKLTTGEQEIEQEILLRGGFFAVEDKQTNLLFERLLGKPLGIKLNEFSMHCDRESIDMVIRFLVPYLVRKFPHPEDIAWSNLYKELSPPVQELNDLLDKYSRVIDPEFAKAVVRLSIEVDNLKSGVYGIVEQNTPITGKYFPLGGWVLAEGLRQSLELQYYINSQYPGSLMQALNR